MLDNFGKFGLKTPSKNKNAQTIEDSSENTLISSKRKPKLIETDDGKEFVSKIFTDLLKKITIIKDIVAIHP